METVISFLNGERCDVADYFSHLGQGVFTSLLLHKDSGGKLAARGLSLHLSRLKSNAKAMDLDLPSEKELCAMLKGSAAQFSWSTGEAARVRVVALPKSNLLIQLEPFTPRFNLREGVVLYPVSIERTLPTLKSCSAAASLVAQRKAKAQGADEALLVDRDGFVREGAWSNLFWVSHDAVLHTVVERALPGVTQSLIRQIARRCGMEVSESEVSLQELEVDAREIFLTLSTYGVVPVRDIIGVWREPNSERKISGSLMGAYQDAIPETV
ncbi:MAG: aminotransferase class IV [Oligoflexia bacterium]|nr:aminotransferase class IV [Oligoflexia bacterium]